MSRRRRKAAIPPGSPQRFQSRARTSAAFLVDSDCERSHHGRLLSSIPFRTGDAIRGNSNMQVSNILRALSVLSFAGIVAVEPAFAGCLPVAVPAPLLGAGIPALIAFGAGYWAIRKRPKG